MAEALTCERLLATGEARQELVLLHGWASTRECWRPLLASLRPWANITLLDLPGLSGGGQPMTLEALLEAIAASAPPRAVYVGWSLGGQLATRLASRYSERVAALITVASNPCFTAIESTAVGGSADDEWPGVPPQQLAGMRQGYISAPARTLRRFEALEALNAANTPALSRALAACRPLEPVGLEQGLEWLAELDTRVELATLELPQLHLLGGDDTLVPAAALAPALERVLAGRRRASVQLLPGVGHALPLEAPRPVAEAIQGFISGQGLLVEQPAPARPRLDKAAVAGSFSRAATGYDSVACLQRDVGHRLLQRLDGVGERVDTVLDLGCGTGYFQPALARRFPDAQYIGLDIATGMLDYARHERGLEGCWAAGDAEQLPLAANSVDLVFSSLAIQWCQQPEALFAELARVLRPGATCVFSTLGPATLHELRSAWAAVDAGHTHVNEFLPASELENASARVGRLGLRLEREDFRMHYDRVRELIAELKTLGAHNVNGGRPTGLGGRRALCGMVQAYERFRDRGRLPASYEVYFGHLEKAA